MTTQPLGLKVNIIVGAQHAYACIKRDGHSLDVKLSRGKSAQASLRESAKDARQTAEKLLRQAETMEAAAGHIENNRVE